MGQVLVPFNSPPRLVDEILYMYASYLYIVTFTCRCAPIKNCHIDVKEVNQSWPVLL